MPQLTTFRLYLLGIALLFVGYVVLEYNRPKPVDWEPTYANKDKIPYGTYVLYDQLPRLLGTDSIEAVRLPVYTQLTGESVDEVSSDSAAATTYSATLDTAATELTPPPSEAASDSATATEEAANATTSAADRAVAAAHQAARQAAHATDSTTAQAEATEEENTAPDEEPDGEEYRGKENDTSAPSLRPDQANYLFINQNFDLSRPDALALLEYVARGNNAFIAAQRFSSTKGLLHDSLKFDVEDVELATHKGPKGFPVVDSVDLHFTNPALSASRFRLPGAGVEQRLLVDSGRVGRTLATDTQGRAVFVRLAYGRGYFYLCTAPVAFTNYFLLRPRTTAFAASALAYLPARRTWWDEYQKQGPMGEQSLLRVVMEHEALRLAYYLCLTGGLLFVLIKARRRQRVIPTIKPLPNTTLLFTRTVASLYRQGSSHALIAEKKVGLFMDYLRVRFQETNPDFGDAEFRERLSQKSGLAQPRLDELLRLVNFARTAPQVTDKELLQLSKALSDFKREVNY